MRQETVTVGVWIDAGSRFETKDPATHQQHAIILAGQVLAGEQRHCSLSRAHGLQRHKAKKPNSAGAGLYYGEKPLESVVRGNRRSKTWGGT